jgi:hypothetical protein
LTISPHYYRSSGNGRLVYLTGDRVNRAQMIPLAVVRFYIIVGVIPFVVLARLTVFAVGSGFSSVGLEILSDRRFTRTLGVLLPLVRIVRRVVIGEHRHADDGGEVGDGFVEVDSWESVEGVDGVTKPRVET